MFSFIRDTFSFIIFNLFDITLVTLAWLGLQLPVITSPAATVAVYHFARQAVLQDDLLPVQPAVASAHPALPSSSRSCEYTHRTPWGPESPLEPRGILHAAPCACSSGG